jgi:hypothetical protein
VTKLVRIYIFGMIECSERCFLLLRALQTHVYEDIASAIELVFNYLNYFGMGWAFKGGKQGKGEDKMFLEGGFCFLCG